MGQPKPTESSGSNLGRVFLIALAVGVLVVVVLAYVTHGGDKGVDTTPPEAAIAKQLKADGYHKARDEKRRSDELNRDVVTEWWERSQVPEQVVITDDSPYTEKGKLVVGAVIYNDSGGKGKLTCQPDPEHIRADLSAILADANTVHGAVHDGTIQPDPNAPGGFPYHGEFMGCKP